MRFFACLFAIECFDALWSEITVSDTSTKLLIAGMCLAFVNDIKELFK
jgi:hypothetical protein